MPFVSVLTVTSGWPAAQMLRHLIHQFLVGPAAEIDFEFLLDGFVLITHQDRAALESKMRFSDRDDFQLDAEPNGSVTDPIPVGNVIPTRSLLLKYQLGIAAVCQYEVMVAKDFDRSLSDLAWRVAAQLDRSDRSRLRPGVRLTTRQQNCAATKS